MPITVAWHDEPHTTIHMALEWPWAWRDYYTAQEEIAQMMDGINHTVHILYDLQNSPHTPNGALSHFRKTAMTMPLNTGLQVITGGNMFHRTLFNAFQAVAGEWAKSFRFVASIENAEALLAQAEPVDP